MLSTTDFRRGLKIEMEGTPYEIVDFLHVKPGKGGAFVRSKLKNMLTGAVLDYNFRSGEKVKKPDLETRTMQYLYHDGEAHVFMDMTSYEQLEVPDGTLGEKSGFLREGQELKVLVYNEQPIDVEVPPTVVLEVEDTDPGVKGDTVTGATKSATLESGAVVNVPLFIETGEKVKIDTRTKEYVGRG